MYAMRFYGNFEELNDLITARFIKIVKND